MSPGSCPRRAWAGGADGRVLEVTSVPPMSQPMAGKTPSLGLTPRGLPGSSAAQTNLYGLLPSPCPVCGGNFVPRPGWPQAWVSLRKGREERADVVCEPRRLGATPAAKVTVGEVDRGHELLHPLESGAPVLQERRCRHGDVPCLPGRSLVLPARCIAWNQRFRHSTSSQTRAAFLGTPRLLQEAGFGEPSP